MEKKFRTEEELIGNWQRKSRQTSYENNWIKVSHDEVINPNGGEGIYGVVHYKNLAIGVIPLDEHNNTWLVGQHRYPQNKFSWEIPEGGGPLGIDPIESAKRELQEEVGLTAENYELILEMDLSNSVSDEQALIYVAKGLTPVNDNLDETEVLEVVKKPITEVLEMVIKGEITDSMSVAGILKLARELNI
jgi:8-oxo-dGTP pyrophosphatase MutT (NUDIX family)